MQLNVDYVDSALDDKIRQTSLCVNVDAVDTLEMWIDL